MSYVIFQSLISESAKQAIILGDHSSPYAHHSGVSMRYIIHVQVHQNKC